MTIKLYTTHCPQCKALEMKLNKKSIEYTTNDNIEEMKIEDQKEFQWLYQLGQVPQPLSLCSAS